MEILKKRLDMMMDNPIILATDIIPIVNYAWKGFARVKINKRAIANCGWNPLNFNLFKNKQIAPTMTNSEITELQTMLKDGNSTIATSSLIQQSST